MENNLIKTVIKDHIAVVTMDAPPVNAQSREFVEELISVFDELNETPGVRVVVLTGAGKCFCAGADIKSRAKVGQGVPGDTNRHLRRAREVGFVIIEMNIPVIAAVNGVALGAGMGLAICSDMIVASKNASFGLPEIDIGLMGGVRHTMRVFPQGPDPPDGAHRLAGACGRTLPPRPDRGLRRARGADGHRNGNCPQHRVEEPGRDPPCQACHQHRRDHGTEGRLPLRAKPDGRNDPARRQQGSMARLRRKARPGVQGRIVMAEQQDWNSLSDAEFRQIFRSWVDENCSTRLRNMRKQRPVFDESLTGTTRWRKGLALAGLATGIRRNGAQCRQAHHLCRGMGPARLPAHSRPRHWAGRSAADRVRHRGAEGALPAAHPSGEDVWCQGYSEPGAGSDLASLRTAAVCEGDSFIVNGQKIWTTLAHCANWILLLTRTSRDEKVRQKGITVLLVDLTSPGVTVRPIENLRQEADFCEVFFENVRVPAENLVGEVDKGWNLAKAVLGHERIFLGAPSRPEVALSRLEQLAEARGAFADPAFVARYARLRLDLYDLGSAFERFAKQLRDNETLGADVSVLKIFCSELYQKITEETLDIAGEEARFLDDLTAGNGEVDAMNLYLDSRALAIFGGSNEIQRTILAKAVLGLPS